MTWWARLCLRLGSVRSCSAFSSLERGGSCSRSRTLPRGSGFLPVIWMIFAGALVLVVFVWWENRRVKGGEAALIDPAMLRNLQLRGGVMSFFFMFLIQAGLFFTLALFLSVTLGVSAVETGVRLLPLSLSLLLFAVGVPKLRPDASPRRVVRLGFIMLFAGLVLLVALLDVGVGAGIVTWPLLLAGSGLGMMASQLGAVTVSAVPDEKSGEVGGLQNTGTQLGASIGTALAGAVLISAMTASFFTGIENNPKVPDSVVSQAHTQLAGGVPFMSEADTKAALQKANVPTATADEIVKVNKQSQIDGLRAAEAILALLALVALPFTRGIPTVQPGAQAKPRPSPA